KEQAFTKADKMMVILYLIHHGALEEKIFDLMSALQISVNDSLTFNEIKAVSVSSDKNLKNKQAFILSHHLMGTIKPPIIKALLKKELDFNSQYSLTKDNILHSFFHFLFSNSINEEILKNAFLGLELFLNEPQATDLLADENLFEVTPLLLAFNIGDEKIYSLFEEKLSQIQMDPDIILSSAPAYGFWNFLSKQKSLKFSANDIIAFNFQAFLDNLYNFLKNSVPIEKFSSFNEGFNNLTTLLKQGEEERVLRISQFLFLEDKTTANEILTAIFNRDKKFFKNLESKSFEEKERFNLDFYYEYKGMKFFLSSAFIEAIRQSFTPAVEYFLKELSVSKATMEMIYPEGLSHSLDPLSTAFLIYSSLDTKDPLKKSAKEIINLLYKYLPEFKPYNSNLGFSPLEWAALLGLKEDVQFLHETKKVEFVENYLFAFNNVPTLLNWKDYLTKQKFDHLVRYLFNKETEKLDYMHADLQKTFIESRQNALEYFNNFMEKTETESKQKTLLAFSTQKKKSNLYPSSLNQDEKKDINNIVKKKKPDCKKPFQK
ncbi:MAG: hypothetical protein OXC37_02565, partial [Bdellovibrionaceae bacterium]|nr:hypothetical protein [Pseudobdellovibrionaceae bacterium]